MELKERTKRFLAEMGLPVTRFANNVNLSADAVRKWLRGALNLSDPALGRIDAFLKKYGA